MFQVWWDHGYSEDGNLISINFLSQGWKTLSINTRNFSIVVTENVL